MGQVFNKRLDSNEKQEGFLKRLKNIEGKNEQQLDLIRDQGDGQLDKTETGLSNKEVVSFYDGPDNQIKDLVNRTKNENKVFYVKISDNEFNINRSKI